MVAQQQVPNTRYGGVWYYVVTIVTGGVFAVIPFVHAASRLGRRSVWARAALFGAIDAVMFVVVSLREGRSDEPVDTVLAVIAIAVIIGACVQLRPLRREVFGPAVPQDPAVARVLVERGKRDEARALAERDPLMARELGIGRPDLSRTYDDGGLVDLAAAPADAIAAFCGLAVADAERVVAARGVFSSVDELLVVVELPIEAWERVRDRGVVVRA
ncbi:ComEA family DNA-binding protein [Actinokineospora sp. HUAS TT18]|uniref:ComEA family DNA-binding protein n=1 Tax=Actinokineospora sp. HUAS TT18 TaxID=3447451 RepID=UPI003F52378B